MVRRSFIQDGKTYSDAPAGWLKAHKDEWDGKVKARGHRPVWRKTNAITYEAECRTCGGHMACGTWGSHTATAIDLRSARCA
jgi:hypothetical protein